MEAARQREKQAEARAAAEAEARQAAEQAAQEADKGRRAAELQVRLGRARACFGEELAAQAGWCGGGTCV